MRDRPEQAGGRRARARLGAGALLVALVAIAAGGAALLAEPPAGGPAARPTPSPAVARIVNTPSPTPPPSPTVPVVDGSLGDANTRLACTLLTKAEIEAQFGGPVSDPIPVYPTCRWEVGPAAFVSVLVAPGVPLDEVPVHAPRTKRASADGYGLGTGAYFGTNRLLYFADERASYWVSYQEVNDYISIAEQELAALAGHILAKDLPADARPSTDRPSLDGIRLGPPTVIGKISARRPLRVFYAGDSMAAGPSWGLSDVIEDLPAIELDAEYQVGSGMIRDDFFDWYRHLAASAASLRPQVIVWQSGANDRQPMRLDGEILALGTEAWAAEYRRRIEAYMTVLAADGRRLFWVGLPPMEDPDAEAFALLVNGMVAAAAKGRPGVTYVDAYRLFAGPGGGYAYELDVDGEQRAVRTPDGLHLNVAGSLRLAHAILDRLAALTGLPVEPARPPSATTRDGAH